MKKRRVFFLNITMYGQYFQLLTDECNDWENRIKKTQKEKMIINEETNEKTKLLHKKITDDYIYLSFVQGENLDEEFVEAEDLEDVDVREEIRFKRLYFFLFSKVTGTLICNWPRNSKYSTNKYKKLLFTFFDFQINYIKINPYAENTFIDNIVTAKKIKMGYRTEQQQLELFNTNNHDLPFMKLAETFSSSTMNIELSDFISFSSKQKKVVKKFMDNEEMLFQFIGLDKNGVEYMFDKNEVTRKAYVFSDFKKLNHNDLMQQLIELMI